jgi:hypothetical protein
MPRFLAAKSLAPVNVCAEALGRLRSDLPTQHPGNCATTSACIWSTDLILIDPLESGTRTDGIACDQFPVEMNHTTYQVLTLRVAPGTN